MIRDNNVRSVFVTRVIDGDTFAGNLYLLSNEIQFHDQRFRLYGVDTPEHGEAGYNEATEFLRKVIEEKVVFAHIAGKDSFGRWLVHVHTEHSERSINDNLLLRGLAVPYEG
ncbi:thermonuclease family protein [Bacillus haynesii]|uniref:thermonuclease family protein n=1 Tax=Bacillus haynesii TaxID=1925021 RepID=UPI002281A563|nr:thermonuclease family protein [Bacillus haynesii]MCY8048424.1 thermonuclease family protein [Bacillus haynesii]MCY8668839.1 thermonuclease family protein [Bacillus haynesii]MCY9324099.1 thermonuclease family protein [Bacillus haynesii]